MKGYKLVSQNMKTRVGHENETTWEIGKTISVKEGKMELCTNTVIHYYSDPVVAIIMNCIHANITNPRMFEVETSDEYVTDGLKYGCKSITLLGEIDAPKVTLEQKVAFGILSSLFVYKESNFVKWANNWLSGKDRTAAAARVAVHAVYAAAVYADAARAAARAAAAAVYAARAAADADARADADAAARAAADAAAAAAARADARADARAARTIDFTILAKKAMSF